MASVLAGGAAASPARAEPPPRSKSYALDWVRLEGGERCVGPRELAVSVEELLGRQALVATAQAELNIEGRVGPRPGGWRATLQISNARGTLLARREITADGPDCRVLDEKVRLSLALIASPDAESRPLPAGWVAPVSPEPDPWKGLSPPPEPDPWTGLPDSTEPDPWTGLPDSTEPDPWHNLPTNAATREARRAQAKAVHKGAEGVELTAFVGYGMGSGVIPLDGVSTRQGLGMGLGVRGDYLFPSGVWLGASYTYYAGGDFEAKAYGSGGFEAKAGVRGSFGAHTPTLEVGYALGAGSLQIRPFFGLGAIFYSFHEAEPFGHSNSRSSVPDAVARNGSVSSFAAWPGLSLLVPFDAAFFSAEARWGILGGSELTFPLSLFGAGGVRF
ncbi:MAG: hypothetical protein MUF34_03160 [Polyangiaceae bacterium]|nr:hypothetical protein [Polyangiaceae bacterium]